MVSHPTHTAMGLKDPAWCGLLATARFAARGTGVIAAARAVCDGSGKTNARGQRNARNEGAHAPEQISVARSTGAAGQRSCNRSLNPEP